MPLIDIEYNGENMNVFNIFNKVKCKDIVYLRKIAKGEVVGFIKYPDEEGLRNYIDKVNEEMSNCKCNCIVAVPVISNPMNRGKPKFCKYGSIEIIE